MTSYLASRIEFKSIRGLGVDPRLRASHPMNRGPTGSNKNCKKGPYLKNWKPENFYFISFSTLGILVLSQVRTWRTPPPFRSGPIFMEDAHSAEPNEKTYFRFFLIFSFRVTADCIYNLRWRTKCPKKCALIWPWYFNSGVFLVRLLAFEIWSILYIADCITFRPLRLAGMWNTACQKS